MAALQKRVGRRAMPWLFLLPNFILFAVFAFLPLALDLVYALTGGDQLSLSSRPFIGGENFSSLLSCGNYLDPTTCERDLFWRSLFNTLLFVVVQVTAMVLIALTTALILNRNLRARGFFRSLVFFPVMLSPVVVALIWKWMLLRQGVFNAWLENVGIAPIDWLSSPNWAFFWAVLVSIWAHVGFYVLILLAGLQAIPRDIYEAADMDATGRWRKLTRITLPLLWPNLLVVIVLALIRGVQTFDEVYVLTGGGPGSATKLIVQFIYETGFATQPRLYGLAAAASVCLAVLLIGLTLAQLRANRRPVNE
ncbi:carbohydrate ABC transporter membrane protein 1, CUT1 family [Arboricoccus pini]|uniref:Carbohydrate ABC transporter membrane protein 1, CUT1 family n=1 Tax=Arboricoccus pini TaxID=1963835 RepID=A0A212R871_9PROT|nr:sugar ABC transporter permease [Arboricoccus pini]SNB68339.1 carbohydrate ABC transporter membrane protein 1, CUT1 family [Arboricoccus pini]